MAADINHVKSTVRRWVEDHPEAVLFDQEAATLLDVASGKAVKLPLNEVRALEEKKHPETGSSYLVVLFENGTQIALVDPGGVAFAPSLVNTGSLPFLPAVVCLKDYFTLKARVDHYLYDHPDEPPPRECLDIIMICIATLDGARAAGFDIGEFERELERSLDKIGRNAG